MFSFTITLEVMSRMRAQRNGSFRGRYEISKCKEGIQPQWKQLASKMSNSVQKVGSITTTT